MSLQQAKVMAGKDRLAYSALASSLPSLTPEGVEQELVKLRKRHDQLLNECSAQQKALSSIQERSKAFVAVESLDSVRNDDAIELDRLEDEVDDCEEQLVKAAKTRKTYELLINRLRDEGKHFGRDLEELDRHARVKEQDATQLALMVKDASDVRDTARNELARATERKVAEIQELEAKVRPRREP